MVGWMAVCEQRSSSVRLPLKASYASQNRRFSAVGWFLRNIATSARRHSIVPSPCRQPVCGCVPARVSVALPMARRLLHGALGGLSRPRCGLNLPRPWPRRTLSALAASAWHATTPLPADPILGLVAAFKEDTAAQKVNLAQGAYRTDAGTPFVLASVKEAERRVAADLRDGRSDKEYLPIEGHAAFRRLSAELVLGGESPSLREGRVATLQTLSGTGALSVAAAALHRVGGIDDIYVPDPSWGNHQPIFTGAGLRVHKYTYLDERGTGLDFDGMARDLAALPEGCAVLLHACAHNPTGVDPSVEQWGRLAQLFVRRGILVLFDSAYQGYASGDLDADGAAVRLFEAAGVLPVVCQSYAKSDPYPCP